MATKIMKFDNEAQWLAARKSVVTATDVAALLGLSKWKSRFKLWHEKKGNLENDFVDNDRAKWGKRLQNIIAQGICEDNGWQGEDLGLFFIQDEETRLAASLDVKVICPDRGEGLMEVKNVGIDAFAASWTDEEAPAYYETQLMAELHMAHKAGLNLKWGVIAALVGGNSVKLYFREYDPEIGAMFDAEAQAFWLSIEDNEEPKPDFTTDSAALSRLRGAIIEKMTVDITGSNRAPELIAQYQEAQAVIKEADLIKDAAKAELLDIIGNADKATLPGFSITAGMVAGTHVEYDRAPYRNFRINKLKSAA